MKELKEHLKNIDEKPMKSILKKIILGKEINADYEAKNFVYRFTDLIFNLEADRDVSVYISNLMILEPLVSEGIYQI